MLYKIRVCTKICKKVKYDPVTNIGYILENYSRVLLIWGDKIL